MAERQGKVFAQVFFKKLAVGKAEPYGLDLDLKWATAKEKLGKQRSAFPGRWGLALSVLANASPLSPAGSGDAAQWAASITDRRGSGDQALNGAHWAPAPPKGGGET